MAQNLSTTRYLLSVGGGALRLWEKQRGLVAEVPSCAVVDKETGELKLYGEEAAELEGKIPSHLEFVRVWSGDKIMDRDLLRSLLRYLMSINTLSWHERYQRMIQTTLVVPETVPPLHLKWLRKTAREAGWLLTPTVPMAKAYIQRQNKPSSLIQSVLDIGFTTARLVVVVGDEVVLASAAEQLSMQSYCDLLAEYLLSEHALEVSPSVFYDQMWQQSRWMFNQSEQSPQQYAPTAKDLKAVNKPYQIAVGQFVKSQLQRLTDSQQAELQRQGMYLIGGGAGLLAEDLISWPLPLKRTSDARYAVLRALSQTKK